MDFSSVTSLTSYATAIPVDWIIFGGCALFLSFDALRAGPARVTALALALPLSLYLSASVPATAFLGSVAPAASDAMTVGIFVLLTIGLFVVFYRIVDGGMDSLNVGYALLAGISAAAVLMTIVLQLPESTWPWAVSEGFRSLFGEAYRLFWILGALLVLAFIRR